MICVVILLDSHQSGTATFYLPTRNQPAAPPHTNIATYEDPPIGSVSILAHILYNSERIGLTNIVLH